MQIIEDNKEDFDRVLKTGVFLGIKHATRVMIPTKSGSIISIASIGSCIGGATTHAYTASKHAILGLTKNSLIMSRRL